MIVRLGITLFVFMSFSIGQVHVTLSQQGSAVLKLSAGSRIKGIGIAVVTICNKGTEIRSLDSQLVYEGIAHLGIDWIMPDEAIAQLNHAGRNSRAQVVLDSITIVTTGVGAAAAGRSVAAPGWLGPVLLMAPYGLQWVRGRATSELSNASPVTLNILKDKLALDPGLCAGNGKYVVYYYHGTWNGVKEFDVR